MSVEFVEENLLVSDSQRKYRKWPFLGREGGVGGSGGSHRGPNAVSSSSGSVSSVSDTQILGKMQQSAHLTSSALEYDRF